MVFLLIIGGIGAAPAFWLITHPRTTPGSVLLLAISMGVLLLSLIGTLLIYLRWRGQRRSTTSLESSPPRGAAGTVYGLIAGHQYRVLQSFTDYYGNTFEQGQLLHFKQRHFLPYEGGHTIVFHERSLYLQEEANREILEKFSEYISSAMQ